jgi:glyoxylase-like metal-dependent hydrolase (beta-lactamase superfamily II)/rhodanese-related sulfurtransferase
MAKELVSAENILHQSNQVITNINTKTLQNMLVNKPDLLLIDVRTEKEITITGTIKSGQNLNIPRGWLEFRITDFAEKNTPIVVYCGRNLRSPLAAKTLMDMGFENVSNYQEGYFTWRDTQNPVRISDFEPENLLYRKPKKVLENVYSATGATQPPSYENSNHNNNLSFIVTTDGVLVFNAGGSYLLAQAMHQEIQKVTSQKVKYVVLENAQGHAILGASYWKEQGAIIIAHQLTLEEIKKNGSEKLARIVKVIKDKATNTKIVLPDEVFEHQKILQMGDTRIELLHIGASHSADDIQLWLPEEKLLISGDTAFNERMLPIFKHTDTAGWIKTWDKIVALNPKIIIPGHGHPTDLATITKFTKDYLVYMRSEIEKILDEDGGLTEAYQIDQSRYKDWGTYRELHQRNAARIFKQMEFE